jgi:iron complex transport system substrate-binding protein
MRRLLAALLASVALVFPTVRQSNAAAPKPFPVTVVDDHNNRVRITQQPKRLISLFPGQTEMLFALGLEKRVVADSSQYAEGAAGIVDAAGKPRPFKYPSEWPTRLGRDYPVRAPQMTHVEGGCCGTHFNLETIEAANPDLVFAPYTQTELPTYQKLRELGLKVIILDPANLKGVLHDVELVGTATGATRQARALAGALQKQMSAIKTVVARVKTRPRVYYEIDATNPTQPYTAGHGTYIDDAIKLVRGTNVADASHTCSGTLCYPQLDLESLVQLNPQIIVLGDSNYGVTPGQVKTRSGWESMAAVRSGKIYRFNDDLISRAGPRIMIGVHQLALRVHPELFKKR